MSTQHLKLNVLTFDHPTETIEVGLFRQPQPDMFPIAKREVPLELWDHAPELEDEDFDYLYSDFTKNEEADYCLTINLATSKRFAKHYYTWQIKQHFKEIANISIPNFIRDMELWFKDKERSTKQWTTFEKYVIKVNMGRVTNFPELAISYEGHSRVYNTNLLELDAPSELFKWVIYQREKLKYGELLEEVRLDLDQVYPVLNNPLIEALGLETDFELVPNKYARYYDKLQDFIKQYLDTEEFKEIIPLYSTNFINIKDYRIGETTQGSNQLVFGKGQSGVRPIEGLRNFGPHTPSPFAHVRMFFIVHEDDAKTSANKLYSYLKDGYRSFKGLNKFIRLPAHIKPEEQITFKNADNPLPEIREELSKRSFDSDFRHIAIYIPPILKENEPAEGRTRFINIKEELLKYGITSQAVEKDTIADYNANYSLSNIAIAILAKLDGVPWRLQRTVYSELIAGVGAFKSAKANNRYIGSAFCFSNDGRFQGFECYSENDTLMLAGSIRKAVKKYAALHNNVKRLVIHFYKIMSQDEMRPIIQTLKKDLELEIPVIIITINKTSSKDLVVFDVKSSGRMPLSGTFINVGKKQFLLCNNTRYSPFTKLIDSYPFPVKISMQSSDEDVLKDQNTVQNLIDQVYQFSRMYWKSEKQQNLPVTIKYPEMVAEVFPYFSNNTIPPFGRNNLWFL